MDRYVVRFAYLFGVRPWEIELLQYQHYRILKAEADAWAKTQKQSQGVRGGH